MIRPNIHASLSEILGYLGVVFLFVLFNLYLATRLSTTTVDLILHTEQPQVFQVYWRSGSKTYMEKNSIRINVVPETKEYSFKMLSLANFNHLRIDPVKSKQPITIEKAVVSHLLYTSVQIIPTDTLADLKNIHQMRLVQGNSPGSVFILPRGEDPHFEVAINPMLNLFALGSLILLAIGGTISFFLVLNQTLIKGGRSTAILELAVPANLNHESVDTMLIGLRQCCPKTRLQSKRTGPTKKQFVFRLHRHESQKALKWLHKMRKKYHQLAFRLYFNRSGEI